MNNSVHFENKIKFNYSPMEFVDNVDFFIRLSEEHARNTNLPLFVPRDNPIDLICKLYNSGDQHISLQDIRSRLPNEKLLEYIEPILKDAEDYGITAVQNFQIFLQGNNKKLNYPAPQLGSHTHLFGDIESNDIINTYTVVIPLFIEEEITEMFWAKWIDDIKPTVTSKLKILLMNKSSKTQHLINSAFSEWWDALRKNSVNNEFTLKLPNKKEKLILDFNSRNFVHGVDNLGNNIYLMMLFDGYKK